MQAGVEEELEVVVKVDEKFEYRVFTLIFMLLTDFSISKRYRRCDKALAHMEQQTMKTIEQETQKAWNELIDDHGENNISTDVKRYCSYVP